MTNENETVSTTPDVRNFYSARRISWTAIFTGAIVGIGLSFLLGLLGAAIGLSIVNMTTNRVGLLALSGSIGVLISIIISMLIAGFTAGYLGRLYCPHRNLGTLYGFTTWTIVLMLSAVLTTHMSAYVATYTNPAQTQVMNAPVSSQPPAPPQGTTAPAKISTTQATPSTAGNATNAAASSAMASPLSVQPNSSISGNQIIIVRSSPITLVWGAFLVFGFFFIGALFCCIGAKWGMRCRRDS